VGAIDSIDPNPDNYVAAAIIHTRAQQIGCLLRLEPNIQAEVDILLHLLLLQIMQKCVQ